MINVKFYDSINDEKIKFAVIVSQFNGKWVFCKHKERSTYEIPGGHREVNEKIIDTAKRELFEETGAVEFNLFPVSIYSVIGKTRVNETGEESFGMLYYAEIIRFDDIPSSEIEKVVLFSQIPNQLTYPLIQPKLIEKVINSNFLKLKFKK